MIEPLLDSRQSAAVLAISTRTLFTLKDEGLIPYVQVGRSVRYDPSDLRDYIDKQKRNGGSAAAETQSD